MSDSPDTCIFCQILNNNAAASIVYQDDDCTAFMDIEPINPGHLLVIPNKHAACLAQMPAALAGRLMAIGHRLAAALRASGLRCEGINLFLADGEVAGQEVFHVHLHVVPRYPGDGFGLQWRERSVRPRQELDDTRRQITQVLEKL